MDKFEEKMMWTTLSVILIWCIPSLLLGIWVAYQDKISFGFNQAWSDTWQLLKHL